jgi:hypothetical protein
MEISPLTVRTVPTISAEIWTNLVPDYITVMNGYLTHGISEEQFILPDISRTSE